MDSGEDAERDRGWSSDRWMEVSVTEVGKHPRPHHFTGGKDETKTNTERKLGRKREENCRNTCCQNFGRSFNLTQGK